MSRSRSRWIPSHPNIEITYINLTSISYFSNLIQKFNELARGTIRMHRISTSRISYEAWNGNVTRSTVEKWNFPTIVNWSVLRCPVSCTAQQRSADRRAYMCSGQTQERRVVPFQVAKSRLYLHSDSHLWSHCYAIAARLLIVNAPCARCTLYRYWAYNRSLLSLAEKASGTTSDVRSNSSWLPSD